MSDSQIIRKDPPRAALQRALAGQGSSEALTLGLIVLLCLMPLAIGGSWMFTIGVCFANSIGVLAVSTLVRYGGEVSIGHGFFAAVGAYSVAILDTRYGLSLLASLPLALLLGVASGIGFAWPSRKISGIYLAVSTMALALAVPEMINNADALTGGYEGLYVSQPVIPGISMSFQRYYAPLIVLLVVVYALARLRQSRQGRALLLSKAYPAAADAFGTRKDWSRIAVMGISGGIAALCGAALGFAGSTVSPSGFTLWSSIFLLVGSVVSFYGLTLPRALIGGAFLTLIPQLLSASGAWIPVLYGMSLLGVILFGHYLPQLREWVDKRRGGAS